MIAELERGDFLLWEGVPAPNHTRSSGALTSRYFAWSAQPQPLESQARAEPMWLEGRSR
jgi:hypothetical protein